MKNKKKYSIWIKLPEASPTLNVINVELKYPIAWDMFNKPTHFATYKAPVVQLKREGNLFLIRSLGKHFPELN